MPSTTQILSVLPVLSGLASAGLVPQKRADICGVKGYDRDQGNYDYNNSGKFSTYATCSARCSADSKCQSFAFGGKECLLFNIPLTGNFDADSASADTYYDRGCISGSSPAPSTTTTTKAAAPTTTTTKAPTTVKTTTTKSTKSTTTKATTTAKAPTTTAVNPVSSPTLPTATTVSIPPECTNITPTIEMTSFSWFNSTHNLDCVTGDANFPSDAQVCWNSTSLCNAGDPGCTCTGYCLTGLPQVAYTPLGYGPPDTITASFAGAETCSAANPQSIRRNELGGGHYDCGSAADIVGFYGDSNKDTGNTGSIYYNGQFNRCNNAVPRYTASFPLLCSRDAGNNATCTTTLPVILTLAQLQ